MTGANQAAGAVALVLLAATGGASYFALKPTARDLFLQRCEEVVRGTLRSPSTYSRVEASEVQERFATQAEIASVTTSQREAFLDASGDGTDRTFRSAELKVYFLTVDYDAANAYGTPIRGSFTCGQMAYGDMPLRPDAWPILTFE